MILTKKQEEGLKIAVERFRNHQKYTCIAGYAGVGKSTLIRFIIDALNVNPEEDVCYIAYTGKAATVLRSKGCQNATTAHKLLYHAKPMPNGTYKFTEKTSIGFKVVVVDEVSMLPKAMWERLLKHDVYILATGDPGQLPPIDKETDNHVLDNPHIFLDEIMRQAQDSEIIRLSMWVREGKSLASFPCLNEQVMVCTTDNFVKGMYDWADQILCATNPKRNGINEYVRASKQYDPNTPTIGDKIISLRNHWDDASESGEWALTNGTIGHISSYDIADINLPRYIYDKPISYMYTNIELEDNDRFLEVPIDYNGLITGTPTLNGKQCYQLLKNPALSLTPPYEFAYAYAITCHKAQGSEWNKVLVFEEKFPFDPEEHKRWLYTAVTRAKEKLVIIRK